MREVTGGAVRIRVQRVPHFLGGGRIGTQDRSIPDPGAGQLLLRVRANALCGTDRAQLSAGSTVTPGHEAAGEVVGVGSGLEEAVEVITLLVGGTSATYEGRHYRLDGAQALPRSIQRPGIPILIAAHRPRMLRLAARHADIWDTFPTSGGTATEGVTSSLAERVTAFDAACREQGRDPATIRRSVWVGAKPLESEDAYSDFVEHHRSLGFTDLMTALPANAGSTVRTIATGLIPRLRAAEATSTAPIVGGELAVSAARNRTTS